MKQKVRKLLPYMILDVLLIYGAGLLCSLEISVLLLILLYPVVFLASGILYSLKYKFDWWFLLPPPILFLPAVFLFYNITALFFTFLYPVILLAGMGIGCLLKHK